MQEKKPYRKNPKAQKNRPSKQPKNDQTASSTSHSLVLHPYLQELKDSVGKIDMLYGLHAVEAALMNPDRYIEAIVINPKAQGKVKEFYEKLAKNAPHSFDFIEMERPYFDLLVEGDAVHQGVVMFAHPLTSWSIEDILSLDHAVVMVLDQPSDPRNMGAILRSCAAFGASALVVPDRHSAHITATLAKAAAGAIEHVPIIRVSNLSRAIKQMKQHGFWFVGMDGQADQSLKDIKPADKTALIMGNEGAGLRRLTQEECDFLVKIPMQGQMESLNMSVAAAIGLYELVQKPS